MGVNKVNYGAKTVIDLSKDTVTASKLLKGVTAHDKNGDQITGTYEAGTSGGGTDTSDATAVASNILEEKTAYIASGKVTGTMQNRGATAGTISKKTGAYIIPEGYHNGDGSVTIAEAEREKIVPENIKNGITLLGVSGTYTGDGTGGTEVDKTGKGEYLWAKYTELIGWVKTSEDVGKDRPSGYSTTEYTGATITEDGYYKLDNSIGINKYYLPTGATNGKTKSVLYRPYGYRTDYYILTLSDEKGATGKKGTDLLGYISSDSSDSYPNAGVQDGVYYLAVSAPDVNAIASKMLENTVACGPDGKVTGTIKRLTAQTITPGTEDQNIDAGVYLSGKQTIKGDANLLAENIKEGVELFGITGTYTGGDTVNPYKGKTIVAFGDSIIAGWGWKEGTGIVQPLKEKYPDGTWINNAESGANIAISNNPAHTPIISQIRSYIGQPDAIIFDGGVNDLNNNIAMGNISDSYDSNYDTTTICGAMESALQYVMDTFPLAVKLYIIPHSFSKNNYVDSVHEKMIEICKKWNMPYLDMRKCAQIAMTSKNKSKYTRNANTGVGDGVHPTETWYRKFYAPLVDQRLRDLGIGYTESVAPATVPVTGVTLDKSTLSMQVGDSQKLTSTVRPSNATNQSVKWLASNDNITVSNGTVTAKSTGRAVVTVQTDDGGYTATCDVTIQKKVPEIVPVTGVELNKSQMTLEVDSSVTLIATVKPSTATNQSVKWSVNNSNVIVQNGTVTAKTVGTSIVTVTTNDGNHKAQCTVEVIAKQVQPSEPHTNIGGLNIDGNCYFDTEVLPDQNTNTDIRLYVKSNSTYICGARDDNYKYGFTKTDNFYAIRGTVSSSAKSCTFWEDTWTIKQTGATASFNNNTVELDPIDSFTLTSPYYIGTMSKNGASAGAGMVGAIIYAKIYSGSNLVADMIPVKKSDGTLCLYDEIRKKYLYNKGSGAVTELK